MPKAHVAETDVSHDHICYKSHLKIQTQFFYNTTTFKTLSAQMSARGVTTSLTTWLSQLKPNVKVRCSLKDILVLLNKEVGKYIPTKK